MNGPIAPAHTDKEEESDEAHPASPARTAARQEPLRRTRRSANPSLTATDSQRAAVAGRPASSAGRSTASTRAPHPSVAGRLRRSALRCAAVPPAVPPRLRLRRARPLALPRAGVAVAARSRGRPCGADRGAAADQRPRAEGGGGRTTMTAMAVTAKKLDVTIGDLVEIEGRKARHGLGKTRWSCARAGDHPDRGRDPCQARRAPALSGGVRGAVRPNPARRRGEPWPHRAAPESRCGSARPCG